MAEPPRYPGYDVQAKRRTPSWNEPTRRAIDKRAAVPREPRFLNTDEWVTLTAVAERIVPQPRGRVPVPLAALIDEKLLQDAGDGYRDARLPPLREAWRRGLHALDAEARHAHGAPFARLGAPEQDALLTRMQRGDLHDAAWDGMPPDLFFAKQLARDIVRAYYGEPTAWNEIGFGGPASPRGYVRMGFDRRDPWEAAEAHGGDAASALRKNRRVG